MRQTVFVAAGILVRKGRVLLAQRHVSAAYGGLWEFPGGKLEANESPAHALSREWLEELGVSVDGSEPYVFACDEKPGMTLVLLFMKVTAMMGSPAGTAGQEVRWCLPDEARTLPMPPADHEILRRLEVEGGGSFLDTEEPETVEVFVPLPDDGSTPEVLTFEAESRDLGRVRGFLIATPDGWRAFENLCPHRPLPLNPHGEHIPLDPHGRLACLNHGALFDSRSGLCVSGPCRGEFLRRFDTLEAPGGLTVVVE